MIHDVAYKFESRKVEKDLKNKLSKNLPGYQLCSVAKNLRLSGPRISNQKLK
jgi:hypothetical protein